MIGACGEFWITLISIILFGADLLLPDNPFDLVFDLEDEADDLNFKMKLEKF